MPGPVHYLPILTTAVAIPFAVILVLRYRQRGGIHLLWWAAGVVSYGTGTALESVVTLSGNSVALTRAWYVAGAVLGAYPLAQGSVFLLLDRSRARACTWWSLPLVVAVVVCVLLSPVDPERLEAHRPSGDILVWTWVRALTPFINLYAAGFLVGGAVLSAVRFARSGTNGSRALGNALIAGGALLPAIGGAMAKGGMVEALYVAELLGLVLIWAGYAACVRPAATAAPGPARPE